MPSTAEIFRQAVALAVAIAVAALPSAAWAARAGVAERGAKGGAPHVADASAEGSTSDASPDADGGAIDAANDGGATGGAEGTTNDSTSADANPGMDGGADDAAEASPRHRVAVVITQAVGVGALADRLGVLATAAMEGASVEAIDPATATVALREANGPEPLTCGSEARCLDAIGAALGVRWVLAVGIGRFGGMYGLELRLVDRRSDGDPASASGTWTEPGPDWEVALDEALATLLPAELRAPPRGRLLVRANAPGALFVDGEEVAALPLATPLDLPAGWRAIELRGADGIARTRIEVPVDDTAELDLTLAPPIAAKGGVDWMRTGTWAAGGGAIAALVAAIATHASAASTMDDARAKKDAGEPFASTRQDALDTIGTSRLLYGVAAALAAGAVTLYLLDTPSSAAAPQQPVAP